MELLFPLLPKCHCHRGTRSWDFCHTPHTSRAMETGANVSSPPLLPWVLFFPFFPPPPPSPSAFPRLLPAQVLNRNTLSTSLGREKLFQVLEMELPRSMAVFGREWPFFPGNGPFLQGMARFFREWPFFSGNGPFFQGMAFFFPGNASGPSRILLSGSRMSSLIWEMHSRKHLWEEISCK